MGAGAQQRQAFAALRSSVPCPGCLDGMPGCRVPGIARNPRRASVPSVYPSPVAGHTRPALGALRDPGSQRASNGGRPSKQHRDRQGLACVMTERVGEKLILDALEGPGTGSREPKRVFSTALKHDFGAQMVVFSFFVGS